MAERALRNHQALALAGLRDSLRSGHRRPLLCMPTGAGKTEVFCKITEAALEKGRIVLICVPRLSLVDQTVERLRLHGIEHVGVIQGQHHLTDRTAPVQVCTTQTLDRRGLDCLPDADIVLVDEAHIVFKFQREWMADSRWAKIPFIGFTATPGTKGLGRLYDDLITGTTTQSLTDTGFLVPARVFAPPSGTLPDLKGIKITNTEHGRDYAVGELSKRMQAPKLVADVVETRQVMARGCPTLVFAVDCAH